MKQKWEKPLLQVIVRNKPEEAILSYCKAEAQPNGPGIYQPCAYATVDCNTIGPGNS